LTVFGLNVTIGEIKLPGKSVTAALSFVLEVSDPIVPRKGDSCAAGDGL
jgi:hypothetical protein